MASNQTITAALAIVKVNGVAIGKMRGITCNENIQRGTVMGLGELTPQEIPALSWAGTLTCDFYNIDFNRSKVPGSINRSVQNIKEFVDSLVLQEEGIQVVLYKKIPLSVSPEGVIQSGEEVYAVINGLFIETENFNVNEGQISGKNQTFRYTKPIIFPA